jgi:hypothetical protein
MKTHNAPWGKTLKVVSLIVTVLMGSAPFLTSLIPGIGLPHWPLWLPVLFIPACALFIVRGYTITPDALLIHRPFRDTRIPLWELQSAAAEPKAMRGSIRTFGNGGFYSITGWYWSKSLRSYRAFVTDLNRTVVLRFRTLTVVVSPEDPEAFVRDMNETLAR